MVLQLKHTDRHDQPHNCSLYAHRAMNGYKINLIVFLKYINKRFYTHVFARKRAKMVELLKLLT